MNISHDPTLGHPGSHSEVTDSLCRGSETEDGESVLVEDHDGPGIVLVTVKWLKRTHLTFRVNVYQAEEGGCYSAGE